MTGEGSRRFRRASNASVTPFGTHPFLVWRMSLVGPLTGLSTAEHDVTEILPKKVVLTKGDDCW